MEPNQNLDEQISALVDGECAEPELKHVMSALRKPEHQDRWEIYHRIGDLIRDRQPGPNTVGLLPDPGCALLDQNLERCTDQLPGHQRVWLAGSRKKHRLAGIPFAQNHHKPNLFVLMALLACLVVLLPQLAGRDGVEISASDFFAACFFATGVGPDNGSVNRFAGLQTPAHTDRRAFSYDSNELWIRNISIDELPVSGAESWFPGIASSASWFAGNVRSD